MKALSIQQPWAFLIVNGFKDIENRNWSTIFRGEFLVHAGKTFDEDGYEYIVDSEVGLRFITDLPKPQHFQYGGIVGQADIVDCVRESDSEWFFGPVWLCDA